jgi:hypothetical protein
MGREPRSKEEAWIEEVCKPQGAGDVPATGEEE